MQSKFKKPEFLLQLVIFIFVIPTATTSMLTIALFYGDFTLSCPFCIPFNDPSKSVLQIHISLYMVFGLQVLTIVVICILYAILYLDVKRSQQKVQMKYSKVISAKKILIQVVVTVTANTLTWVPSGIIYISAMWMDQYPIQMILWVIIAVVPINAIINPIIFIKTSTKTIY